MLQSALQALHRVGAENDVLTTRLLQVMSATIVGDHARATALGRGLLSPDAEEHVVVGAIVAMLIGESARSVRWSSATQIDRGQLAYVGDSSAAGIAEKRNSRCARREGACYGSKNSRAPSLRCQHGSTLVVRRAPGCTAAAAYSAACVGV